MGAQRLSRRDGGATKDGTCDTYENNLRTGKIVTPIYPAIAEDYQIEGYVDFEFIVEPDGFADTALKVFSKWNFTPEIIDGKAIATHAFYRFSFKLLG